jgi:hypothetical protein
MDRRTAKHLPRTPQVVEAHLVGDVFMGLYPLLPKNTCQFVVADFDGATAMLDALAYVKTARASAVPATLIAPVCRSRRISRGLTHRDAPLGRLLGSPRRKVLLSIRAGLISSAGTVSDRRAGLVWC